ncbi:TIGR02117 family protein [Sphingomonas sp. Tas61C01]|uniref:TIGR02117 family protein n=1 Tax=Sphingomonas sp. Tas61C01 TaxID=3458297 RepID=UPI00403EB566
MTETPYRHPRIRRKALLAALAAVPAAGVGYAAAGLIGGAIPSNAAWRPPERGVTVFVETNGIHVGLLMPKVAAGVDWRGWAPPRDLADPRYAALDHVAIGWGEHAFFLETPTWASVKIGTIVAAAIGSDRTLMHVEHVAAPSPGDPAVHAITLRPAEYRRLAAYVQASFAPDRRAWRGYAGYDAFYTARGHYSAIRTCNAWTGDALRYAGVKVGRWTPFPVTVMRWF